LYVTRHNIVGSSAARLKEEISALQEKRRAAGLPPLIVAVRDNKMAHQPERGD